MTTARGVRPQRLVQAEIVDTEINPYALASDHSPQAGAVVTFAGVVRDNDAGRNVIEIEYVAHPTAAAVLRRIAEELAARNPDVLIVRVAHRTGTLRVGDCALFAVVCAPHREQAFTACAQLVEDVKRALPVWKRQVFADGSEEWVNSA